MRRHIPKTWARIERLYFEGEFSIIEIAKTCGIHPDTIYGRAKKLKWPPHATLQLEGGFSERATLRRAIVLKLKHLEKRMHLPDTATPTDSERQAREYATVLNTIDKRDAKEGAGRRSLITTTPEAEVGQGPE